MLSAIYFQQRRIISENVLQTLETNNFLCVKIIA